MSKKSQRKKYGNVTYKRVTLYPKDCELLLEKNSINRMMNNSAVARTVTTLKGGGWVFTGETIIIDWYGNVLDGQHRLVACFLSGVPINVIIVYGVDPKAQAVMGRATKRSPKDDLEIRNETNAGARASLANKLLTAWGATGFTDKQKVGMHDLFREVIDFTVVNYASKKGKAPNGVIQMSVASGIARAWFYIDDKSRLEQFCKVLVTGIVADEESEACIITFRDYLQSGKKGVRPDPALLSLNAQEAVRAYIKGVQVRLSRASKLSLYPMPHVDPSSGVKNGATNKTVEWFREQYPSSDIPLSCGHTRRETSVFVSAYKQEVLSARVSGKKEVNVVSAVGVAKKAKEKQLARAKKVARRRQAKKLADLREEAGIE